MFTGIILEVGKISSVKDITEGKEFIINCPKIIKEIEVKDSIAINGTCLTAIELQKDSFKAQAVHITLEKTSLGNLQENSQVNLELALRPIDRMGGHFVQGHVNTMATITEIETIGSNWNFSFQIDQKYSKYIVKEGSISIDGTSLTISDHNDKKNIFKVTIIPHTLENTIFGQYTVGLKVNIEFDMLFKYLESLNH